jgi:deoxyribodipyrimidine photo-lyase
MQGNQPPMEIRVPFWFAGRMVIFMSQSASVQSAQSCEPSPSRWDALQVLHGFLPRLPDYQEGRNYDRPQSQAVSQLSPYIRYRLLSERETARSVLNRYVFEDAESFLFEIGWRTYFKGYLEQHPDIWTRYLREVESIRGDLSDGLRSRLEAACSGQTGIAPFDAWVGELVETGWLHNHSRMWFASIWIFTFNLPWQLGAAFFMEHLLDGDPASNTLGWRWVAGLHTRGKHYLARAENIRRFTEGRFNPEGQLCEDVPSLDDDGPFPPVSLPEVASLKDLQFPSLSVCPAGLLVTPEDLSPETSELSETPFCSICVLSGEDVHDTVRLSPRVRDFVRDAVVDAGERLGSHWDGKILDCRGEVFPMVGKASPGNVGRLERMRIYSGEVRDWQESVLTWVRNENLNSVWVYRPPVGPYADALDRLEDVLRQRGIRLFQYRRRWDSLHWPHATRGYFAFKEGFRARVERSIGA